VARCALRWVFLAFLADVAAAFLANPDWGDVLRHTVSPHLALSSAYVTGAIAPLGTTLTSDAYVWETIEEAEERPPLRRLGLVQLDAGAGRVLAGALCWCIVIATGANLGATGTEVQTAQDAAAALAPAAGRYAAMLFGLGLLASAVLAVLAGTSAYVLAEVCGWRASLDAPFARARLFFGALLASLAIGAAITFRGVGPIRLLFRSSIADGLATPFTLALLLRLASDPAAMQGKRIGRVLAAAGWLVVAVVTAVAAAFLWQTLPG